MDLRKTGKPVNRTKNYNDKNCVIEARTEAETVTEAARMDWTAEVKGADASLTSRVKIKYCPESRICDFPKNW